MSILSADSYQLIPYFKNVPECFRMHAECSIMFQNVPKCSRMFQNIPDCSRMYQNACRMFQKPECSWMRAECSRRFQKACRMFQNAMQNVPECMQKVAECMKNVPECMQNVPEWIQKFSECMQWGKWLTDAWTTSSLLGLLLQPKTRQSILGSDCLTKLRELKDLRQTWNGHQTWLL